MRTNAEAIAAIRERSGLTKAAAADTAGIDRTTYVRIESGERNGTEAQIKSIASMLKVPITAIISATVPEVA